MRLTDPEETSDTVNVGKTVVEQHAVECLSGEPIKPAAAEPAASTSKGGAALRSAPD
jgi:hypothetical protein